MTTTATVAPSPATDPRRLAHPGHGLAVTFLVTADDSGGARTLLEVELEPGAGTPLHVHDAFRETFEVLDGALVVEEAGARHVLRAGDVRSVELGTAHRFVNEGTARACFRVEMVPASRGFEIAKQVTYGLLADGRTAPGADPRDPRHGALLLHWTRTRAAGRGAWALNRLLRALAWQARRSGEERRLQERYVRW